MNNEFQGLRYDADIDDYVVFDIETTGLENAEIIDFAALRVRERQIVDSFRTYIKPRKNIPTNVTLINGITDEMVANAPSFSEVAHDILNFFGDDILVGHYLEKFALKTLCAEMKRSIGAEIENDYIDLYNFAEKCYPAEPKNYRLKSICDFLGVNIEGSTGALLDCRLIFGCYDKAVDTFRAKWTVDNIYSEASDNFNSSVRRLKHKKNVKAMRGALSELYGKDFSDPVMRCSALLPLIKYELYIGRFEDDLKGELYGFRRDFERGLYSRMSIKDIERVKNDIDYSIDKIEKPKKKWFFF
ncbi:MAG: 3'-5' exonuclease [Clostridia bacterium]|nr:3'-5' exonuclease [Clostridia bacterium]